MTGTAGQTVGPFFGFALPYPGGPEIAPAGHPDSIVLHGRVLDGAGNPVPDAILELHQAAPDGSVTPVPGSLRRSGSTFTGWGRAATDGAGEYGFRTLLPGTATEAAMPFVSLTLFARGLLDRLFTRAYLLTADASPEGDPLLTSLPPERRATLLATPDERGFRFDVVLQGRDETVFLDLAHG